MSEYKQSKVLAWAFSFLKEHHREERVAEILLQHHLKMDRATFFAQMQEIVPKEVLLAFETDMKAHALTGIPVQHLTGYDYFYGRKFHVNEHVLIPRMETEELVLHVIEKTNQHCPTKPLTIVDVGTGSGIIAITLTLELTNVTMYATDISPKALQMAKRNAQANEANVTFFQGDLLQPIIDQGIRPDIVVANPPYISWQDEPSLSDTVKDFDPALALFAKEDGLAAYRRILEQVKDYITYTKWICFEIGYDQKEAITNLALHMFPDSQVECIQDINGKDRILTISL